ncbi:non-canonical purine NTP pyrophosphatase, RdgB/HAM1 family [Siphonobacter sp. BAB-5405]|uniref:RdgB/HAM1 family non-canonical purine NTP pyrophosphatase n=1 Tax=Siphonobacter sp. BAB-5405 TaxID=1864825 RepID=UPI000C7FE643|nr:RdgB/HAM1 family non-canonical purine NTP pyrophosphatase [Siphonobacter sp. BAB-5405]PMD93573.1 non-canonical purine NTP pyrophosphatase, RdgB/HAM1 family [Siphonobacter sp. BAB-5405]
MKLVVATNNRHKLEEIQAFLSPSIQLLTLADIGCTEELPETGRTLEANSLQKTKYLADYYQVDCFGDDTGLEITALQGEPGVDSAFYSGSRDAQANMQKVLTQLQGITDRSARFRTVITLIIQEEIYQFEGIVEGTILEAPQGEQGFGYDPIFVPEGYDRSFAQMSVAEKNAINHRTRAVAKMVEFLNQ